MFTQRVDRRPAAADAHGHIRQGLQPRSQKNAMDINSGIYIYVLLACIEVIYLTIVLAQVIYTGMYMYYWHS